MLLIFVSSFVLALSGAMMPGPLLTYTIKSALKKGWSAGLIIIAGHGLLEIALIIVIFLGFDILLQSELAQIIIGMVGGILLACMGIDMLRSSIKNKVSVNTDSGETRSGSMILTSIALSASNPYFLMWWVIIGLGFMLDANKAYGVPGVAAFYLGHFTADAAWYVLISTIVGKTRRFIKDKPYRVIIAVLGLMLVFFGMKFIYGATTGIIKII